MGLQYSTTSLGHVLDMIQAGAEDLLTLGEFCTGMFLTVCPHPNIVRMQPDFGSHALAAISSKFFMQLLKVAL